MGIRLCKEGGRRMGFTTSMHGENMEGTRQPLHWRRKKLLGGSDDPKNKHDPSGRDTVQTAPLFGTRWYAFRC
ncbi:hypothetical protein MA16_Dca003972 [Dendrobium catenatum]|uniref:Uncharacterized protein n=1 Tax=Dendrobium catenatum TaxID=906689 RepID=A0A2I0X222_9ASPA|nr:hypothetical protein MA16_Dca003972 [Dendrobium catenatum]